LRARPLTRGSCATGPRLPWLAWLLGAARPLD
jgi:hypothetical protein